MEATPTGEVRKVFTISHMSEDKSGGERIKRETLIDIETSTNTALPEKRLQKNDIVDIQGELRQYRWDKDTRNSASRHLIQAHSCVIVK